MNTSVFDPRSLRLTGTYELVRLGYVARLQTGLTVDAKRDVTGDVVTRPYLRVANVQAGSLNLESVTEITVPRSVARRSTLRPGDVLMTEGGDLDKLGRGTVWQGELEGCLHQNHIFAIRPDPQLLNGRYLAYLTQSLYGRRYFESTGTRTTNLASTNSNKIQSFPLPLPPLEEQGRIADYLDTETARIDSLLDARQRHIRLVQERWESTIYQELVRPGVPEVELRRLDVEVTTGPFGTVFSASEYQEGGVPMVNPLHIKNGEIIPDYHHSVAPSTAARLARHRLRAGDLVVGRKGDLGRAALVQDFQDGWVCGSDCIAVHPGRRIRSHFLDYVLRSQYIRSQLLARSLAATMPSLNEGSLLSLRVPHLTLDEQDSMGERLDRAHDWLVRAISVMQKQLALLSERRQTLITAAVTGQFDVSTASGRGVDAS